MHRMGYALATIWYERQRFLPAIFAVAFSAILIAVQGGLVIGLLSMMSVPIDKSAADVWIGYPGVQSVDLGQKIPERWVNRVANQPEVTRTEPYVINFVMWSRIDREGPPATPTVVTLIGCRLDADSLGAVQQLREDANLRVKLGEPFTVVVDESELGRLDIQGIGDTAEIMGRRVRVVGTVKGYKSLGGPYVFCSLETARAICRYTSSDCTYILARCRNEADAQMVKSRLARYHQLSAFDSDEFSTRSRMHWLTTTKAGIAVGFTALLGLLVGAVVTSQTLYAATAASQREFATLRAMGIPGWRLRLTVITQSLWVGLFGLLVALPLAWLISLGANALGTQVQLHPLVLLIASCVTLLMAFGSGLAALRSFSGVDPAHNIR
jgi:putative ABC transport system permease protein